MISAPRVICVLLSILMVGALLYLKGELAALLLIAIILLLILDKNHSR